MPEELLARHRPRHEPEHAAHDTRARMVCASCGAEEQQHPCGACGKPALLDGRYRLDAVVGRGAMGVTYRATRLSDGAHVAVKELAFRSLRDLKDLELARREADVLSQLDHPQIPKLRDHFTFGEGKHVALYIVQDFIEGTSLAAECETRRYDEGEVIAILEGLLPALEYLHSRRPPVIHRDLKPSNVMRRPDGSLVLIDFGSVRDALKDPRLGGSTIAGTHGFMAPEQYAGQATPASDIYALGVLAVALLSRSDPASMLGHGLRFDWEDKVEASPAFRALLRRMLEPDPEKRLGTAKAVHYALTRVKDGDYDPLAAERQLEKPVVKKRSKRRIWQVLLALWLVGGAISFLRPERSEPVAAPAAIGRVAGPYHDKLSREAKAEWCEAGYMRACSDLAIVFDHEGAKEQAVEHATKACDAGWQSGCRVLEKINAR